MIYRFTFQVFSRVLVLLAVIVSLATVYVLCALVTNAFAVRNYPAEVIRPVSEQRVETDLPAVAAIGPHVAKADSQNLGAEEAERCVAPFGEVRTEQASLVGWCVV